MTTSVSTVGGINVNPLSPADNKRNWQRIAAFLAAGSFTIDANGSLTIGVLAPITQGGGNISLQLAATPGLDVVSGGLSVLVDPAGALTIGAAGLAASVDGATLAIATDKLAIKAGGVGLTQLGALTTKGDVLGFSTAHVRIGVGADGNVLTADSTQASGVKWGTVSNGTVTSVGLVAPSIFTVSGSPVTTTGNLTITLNTETNGTFFAGAASGTPGSPTFRRIAATDVPALLGDTTFSNLTTGNANVTGQASFPNLVPTLPAQAAATVWAGPATGANATPAFRALAATDIPTTLTGMTLNGANSVSNITITGTFTFPVQADHLFFSGPSTGASAAPTFRAIVASDLPTSLAGITLTGTNAASNLTMTGVNSATNMTLSGATAIANATLSGVNAVSNLTVTGSFTLPTQSAATHFMGPATGAAAAPTFRAQVATDLPGGAWIGATNGVSVLASSFTITATSPTFQDVGVSVSLPAAGTYFLFVVCRFTAIDTSSVVNAFVAAKLVDSTAGADVPNAAVRTVTGQGTYFPQYSSVVSFGAIYTVTGPSTVKMQATQSGLNTASIDSSASGTTTINYVRLA